MTTKVASKAKGAAVLKKIRLAAELDAQELTVDKQAAIQKAAERIRRKPVFGHAPTFKQKRKLIELLDVRVKMVRNDNGGRA